MNEIRRIGIVGDGQLGRMLTEAAHGYGYEVTTLGTAGPNSPAAQVGAEQLEGPLTSEEAIFDLAARSDVLTIEIEHVNTAALHVVEAAGIPVHPSPSSIATIQDKYQQKLHFEKYDLPVAPFNPLDGTRDLRGVRHAFGGQVIAKTRRGGYDGRGNLVLDDKIDWPGLVEHFAPDAGIPSLYAEKIINYQRELAVVGARDLAGRVAVYPVVETIHRDNICHMVYAPAEIDPKVSAAAEELGRAAIESFEGAGVFAVELFQDEDDDLFINEIAPRVHNSGHYSIEGAATSQFQQHIRAITGMPLESTLMEGPGKAVMLNILGTREGEFDASQLEGLDMLHAKVHWYGKAPRPARKLGHITVLAASLEAAQMRAEDIRRKINV